MADTKGVGMTIWKTTKKLITGLLIAAVLVGGILGFVIGSAI